ncbi:hypothetical protein [Haloferula sp. A504]|uniref:hypothetical protein n=1 Tax=Haloferula sp. A504 TaxID=3373601 RepID=UPI0031C67C70|nr:hypothetical protein [Verrucomicrobiaceae bacterium E54]
MLPRDRFLDAAAEPLTDNAELQLAARRQLDTELSPEVGEEELAGAAERLGRQAPGRWRWIWAALVLVASVAMMFGPLWKGAMAWLEARAQMAPLVFASESRLSFHESLSKEDRLLLFGDESVPEGSGRWLPLWESDPENPMFYLEYATADYGTIPEDFLEVGERLDPGNGWFALKAAATGARDVLEREGPGRRDREARGKTVWIVNDESDVARRIELVKQGAMAERIESYHGRLAELRFSKLPRPGEFAESIPIMVYLASMRIDVDEQRLAELFAFEAGRCEREGDREAFRELATAWDRLFRARLEAARTLVETLIVNAGMGLSLPEMSSAAESLEVDAAMWKSRADRWQARKDTLKTASDADLEERTARYGSMLTSFSLPSISRQVLDPPQVTRADLLPATRVEQALLGRMMSGAGWLLLGLFGLASLSVVGMQAPLTRRMAKVLGRAFALRDALWIGGAGVLLPLAIYLVMRYATPLGRMEWGPRLTMYAVPVSHFVGLLLMWIVWPVVVAERRAVHGLGVLGWKRPGWWAWSAAVAPLAGMLCFSFAVPPGSTTVPLGVAGIACGAWSLVWFLGHAGRGVFGAARIRLQRGTVARAVRPAWLGAMLSLALLVVFFHAEERRWFAQDDLLKLGPGFTAYEAEVTEQLKRELREVIE